MPGFGFSAFGTRPFSTILSYPLPAAVALSLSASGAVFTVEIYPVTGTAIYAASRQYNTQPSDTIANTPFNGTVEQSLHFHRSVIDSSRIGGSASGYSQIVLDNSSGEYDARIGTLVGARVVCRVGPYGAAYNQFTILYDGLTQGDPQVSEDTVTLELYDDTKRLDIPVQPSVYDGSGGVAGDSNVKNKKKPLALGAPANATAVLFDATNLVYQLHDGQITGVSHVYDRGIELVANATPDYASYAALIAATITPGRFATSLATGMFRLGAKADGTVTATLSGGAVSNGLVAGYPTSGTALTDTASIVHYLITVSGANVVVDGGSVIATATAQSAAIGYFIGPDDTRTLRQVIDELMYGILGFASFRRDRTLELGLIALPSASPMASYTNLDFYSVKRIALPAMMDPAPYRYRAAYSRNWTQQPDIDATLDASTQTLRKDPYSIAISTNASLTASILAANPTAPDPVEHPSFFVNSADAVAFCNANLTLFGAAVRSLYEISLPADAYPLNICNPINLTDDRFGLTSGKALAILSIDDNTTDEVVTLQAFG